MALANKELALAFNLEFVISKQKKILIYANIRPVTILFPLLQGFYLPTKNFCTELWKCPGIYVHHFWFLVPKYLPLPKPINDVHYNIKSTQRCQNNGQHWRRQPPHPILPLPSYFFAKGWTTNNNPPVDGNFWEVYLSSHWCHPSLFSSVQLTFYLKVPALPPCQTDNI